MGKSSQEKINFVYKLLKEGIPYRDIQTKLKDKFGNGISNTTLIRINARVLRDQTLEVRIQQLEEELALFKRLYFELLEKVRDNDKSISKLNEEGHKNNIN
ncbi:MAG: hypothetical protein RBG13Loki_1611 [Promethearchaeota archaeon CR_4]|nr:MAG: hypothetical protein RBG13Loki_1611 [Candidatus Lokiarchaeota archaeon CR_4]